MQDRQVKCPVCRTILALPPGVSDCPVRCGHCHHRFRLPKHIPVTEEAITSWLSEGRDRDAEDLAAAERDKQATADSAEQASQRTAVLKAVSEPIRLVKLDLAGALFEFPASRLLSESFRCAMPRLCLRCGVGTHLRAHVIIYSSQLRDSISLEAEHSAGTLKCNVGRPEKLSDEELLAALPRVPNVPSPGNLPMPYWLCDMCSSSGMISGQIQVSGETGVGWCRLKIRNLRRAEEFLAAVGGKDTRGYAKLHKLIATTVEKPWDTVPLVVQHRIQQWFHPQKDEHFLAYVPDRDHARTEDGMAGLLISSHRLVYHTQLRHRECSVADPVELTLAMGGVKGQLRLVAPSWKLERFAVDREGVNRLRWGLTKGNFPVTWR